MDGHLPRSRGLVLIELIIVVAILAIIAAMLMPVYANARKKARQARCAASLHQIGSALTLYQTDYDGGWPTASASPWGTAIAPYVRTDYLKLGCTMTRRGTEAISHVPGYAMNSGIYFQSARDPEIQFPSRTVSFCDAPWEIALTTSPDPWMTSQCASRPSSRISGTSFTRISATPPPWRVEFTCRTRRPCLGRVRSRSWRTTSAPATHAYSSRMPLIA